MAAYSDPSVSFADSSPYTGEPAARRGGHLAYRSRKQSLRQPDRKARRKPSHAERASPFPTGNPSVSFADSSPYTGEPMGGAAVVGRACLPCVRGGGSDTKWPSRWGCRFKFVRRAHTIGWQLTLRFPLLPPVGLPAKHHSAPTGGETERLPPLLTAGPPAKHRSAPTGGENGLVSTNVPGRATAINV